MLIIDGYENRMWKSLCWLLFWLLGIQRQREFPQVLSSTGMSLVQVLNEATSHLREHTCSRKGRHHSPISSFSMQAMTQFVHELPGIACS